MPETAAMKDETHPTLTAKAFAEQIGPLFGLDPSNAGFYVRRLRQAGFLPPGTGRTAAPFTLEHAVLITVAMLASPTAVGAPDTVAGFGILGQTSFQSEHHEIAVIDCPDRGKVTTMKRDINIVPDRRTIEKLREKIWTELKLPLVGKPFLFVEDFAALICAWINGTLKDLPAVEISVDTLGQIVSAVFRPRDRRRPRA
jgi:hypothetical protein